MLHSVWQKNGNWYGCRLQSRSWIQSAEKQKKLRGFMPCRDGGQWLLPRTSANRCFNSLRWPLLSCDSTANTYSGFDASPAAGCGLPEQESGSKKLAESDATIHNFGLCVTSQLSLSSMDLGGGLVVPRFTAASEDWDSSEGKVERRS